MPPMTTAAPKSNPRAIAFGRQLRAVMLEKDVSSRELGRRLANGGLTSQAARRTVMRYLAGHVLPSAERRDQIADALGIGRERLNLDEDDEEADLFAVLYDALRAIARYEVQHELRRTKRGSILEETDVPSPVGAATDPRQPPAGLPSVSSSTSQAGPTGQTPQRASQSAQTKGA